MAGRRPKTDLRRGVLRAPKPTTVREVGDKWIRDARAGTVRNRSGDRFADRATKAWERAALTRITLHECRHTFASLMIAAGVNAKALQVFMGHASVSITLDRYGHLFPGSEQEAGFLLDQYLERTQVKPALPTDRDRGETAGKS